MQNIDMMNLAGFCRNCLSNWMKDAADDKGLAADARKKAAQIVYGEPYDEWRAKHQTEASPEQKAALPRQPGTRPGGRNRSALGLRRPTKNKFRLVNSVDDGAIALTEAAKFRKLRG